MRGMESALVSHGDVDAGRLRRLYDTLRRVTRVLVEAENRDSLCTEVCRAAVETAGFRCACFAWYDPVCNLLVPGACASTMDCCAAAGCDGPIDPLSDGGPSSAVAGPVAAAFRSGRISVCNDFLGDAAAWPWHERARTRGIRASLAAPVRVAGAVRGVLAVYGATIDSFQADEISLFEAIAADVSVALDRIPREGGRRDDEHSAHHFAAIVASSNDAIIAKTPAGVITSWNPAAERIFGYQAKEIVGRNIATVIPADRLDEEADILARIVRGERVVDFETVRLRKNGAPFAVSVTISPIHAADGRIVGASKIVRDISDRKRIERELQNADARFRVVIEHLSEGLIITDFEGGLLECNLAARNLLGIREDEPFPRTPREFFAQFETRTLAGEIVPAEARPLLRVIAGEHLRDVEYRVRRRDGGAERILSYSGTVLAYGDERSLAFVAFVAFRDITERHRAGEALRGANLYLEERVAERTAELAIAKERAESADRLKSGFLATMSHELRTPLNSIIGFTGIVLQGMAGPLCEEQTRQLGMVRDSARHLLALINDVLDISKIEAGAMATLREQCDLDASLERVVATIEPLARHKGLRLRVERERPLGGAISDGRRIEQVLLNLLNNAVKFTDQGEIRLQAETRAAPPVAVFRVVDTGIGIAAEDLGALFQPFSQVDSGLTRQHEGTGLGLAICRRLAELLGGTVTVTSLLGSGSEFTFSLPLDRAAGTPPVAAP